MKKAMLALLSEAVLWIRVMMRVRFHLVQVLALAVELCARIRPCEESLDQLVLRMATRVTFQIATMRLCLPQQH
jgi:hypothetical protein